MLLSISAAVLSVKFVDLRSQSILHALLNNKVHIDGVSFMSNARAVFEERTEGEGGGGRSGAKRHAFPCRVASTARSLKCFHETGLIMRGKRELFEVVMQEAP
ncbi:hypothetical protein MPTK1_6g21070 [Marchantia polymorpha subsp. ruderalis]|uniref:Uncharacterized protein n=2 Tax=Marchantia polymorpha TaxID=3197 RepID=A0AAF6BUE0_MARPO|nr:hypothetical protein MARPO_0091s0048 [Marchantia polymorpha]BBN15624.1 hypothetical protein Mp_6g21070 [Marchantia polymorpha subsp. ruderalis]|eukprot:PTQ33192.1 hypothetical protein MARPO_0091s0048 [Marchantia polymorpha]